jgi:hypothetical protein
MNMLMRVDVSRIVTHEATESGQLMGHFGCYRGGVICGNHLIKLYPCVVTVAPFAEIDMESEAKAWVRGAIGSRLYGRLPAHHQASAGHDAVLMIPASLIY